MFLYILKNILNFLKINFELNKNNFLISISYITNFKPSSFLFFNDLKLFKNNIDNKIITRNFFLFLLLLKYFNKNENKNLNTTIFIKPQYKKFITLLRAPYRFKLARHQFVLSRYYVLFTIKTLYKDIFIYNIKDLIVLIKLIKKFYIWFESNIVYQHQVKLFLDFNYKNNFIIK